MFSSFMVLSISKAQEDVLKLKDVNEKLIKINENLEKSSRWSFTKSTKSAIIFHQSKWLHGEMLSNLAINGDNFKYYFYT